jgi:hypothetical protein
MRDPIADLKDELLVAADRQHRQHAGVGDSRRRLHVPLGRNGVVLAAVTVAVVATAALLVTTPWTSSPRLGFLEEVQAALTPPAGAVLHYKVVNTQGTGECQSRVAATAAAPTASEPRAAMDRRAPHASRRIVRPCRSGDDLATI